jgi:hypothetical protein
VSEIILAVGACKILLFCLILKFTGAKVESFTEIPIELTAPDVFDFGSIPCGLFLSNDTGLAGLGRRCLVCLRFGRHVFLSYGCAATRAW